MKVGNDTCPKCLAAHPVTFDCGQTINVRTAPDADMVEAVARAIYKAVTPPESRWECVEPVYQEGVWRAYARTALSVIESRVRAEERERAARIADERAEACRVAGVQGGIDPIEAQILDEHLSDAAAAIRSGDAG